VALERLQKVLARAGLAARRKAEALITSGRVRVDGVVVTELGVKVDARRQRIEVDGRRIQPEAACYGVLHKPRGMVTTVSDPEGRPTAQDILAEVGVRVVPVGRLDFNTSGALLFTNDGDFAQALAHARSSVPKVYAAKVQQYVTEEDLERFRESIDIDGKPTRPAEVRILRREGDKTWLEITLREGKNRQVRRLGDHAGTPVVRLSRLSHAGIDTLGLKPGKWRLLTVTELRELKQKYGVPKKIHDTPPPAAQSARRPAGERSGRRPPRHQPDRSTSERAERRPVSPRRAVSDGPFAGARPRATGRDAFSGAAERPGRGERTRPSKAGPRGGEPGLGAAPAPGNRRSSAAREDRRDRPSAARQDRPGPAREDRRDRPSAARRDRPGPVREDRRDRPSAARRERPSAARQDRPSAARRK